MKLVLLFILGILTMSCTTNETIKDHLNLNSKLNGTWKAKAFDGELHEVWQLNKNGWMLQKGHYIEQNDTSYSASTRIEKINNNLILLSIIKNANPKIFKATSSSNKKIVFENTDYKNPFQVTYEFIDSDNYKRTIKGYENDSLVVYEFNFKKIE